MILYNESGEKISFKTSNQINGGIYGSIYKISETECLKVYKNADSVNKAILEAIKNLHLKNYYELYNFYHNQSGDFKAHTMRYYKKEDIDILTMPSEYTLDNISRIKNPVETLAQNNITVVDTHEDNIIMDSNNITIIDTDLYVFNRFNLYTLKELEIKNIKKIEYLIKKIFAKAIQEYHGEYITNNVIEFIKYNLQLEELFKELEGYKYPIDYIKKKIK